MVRRPILIAELCQNHGGNPETLREMVHAAAKAGANYVKIQALYSAELTRRKRFESESPGSLFRPYGPERKRLRHLDLSPAQERDFVAECHKASVRSMVTVFTRGQVARLSELGFDAVKIASYDCASYPLLRDVKTRWSDIFVSTGGMHDKEITRAAEVLGSATWAFLHCVIQYPTPLDHLNLARMSWLRRFTDSVGLSDHSLTVRDGLSASLVALALGANVIERHFTILGAAETKDGPVSVTPAQLAELREFADLPVTDRKARIKAVVPDWQRLIGSKHAGLSREELLNRDYYAGRVATWVGERQVYNWEDVDLDVLRDSERLVLGHGQDDHDADRRTRCPDTNS